MDILKMPSHRRGPLPRNTKILIALVPVLLFVFIFASSTWYTVEPEEVGVVTRFGAFARETGPGLHFKWPLGIEAVETVQVTRTRYADFGFVTDNRVSTTGGFLSSRVSRSSRDPDAESIMLTGDLNVADVEWVVHYRVQNAANYLFKIEDPEETLRDLSESVMREVVGDRSVDEVLTEGRRDINAEVETKLQELLDRCNSGIRLETVKLQNVNPPERVKPSFNDVNEAKQEKERLINEAGRDYNKAVEEAKGEARRLVLEAEGYALDRVNRSLGDAKRFTAIFEEYEKAPEILRRRYYLEALAEFLPRIKQKIVTEQSGMTSPIPLLQLNKETR